MTTLHQPESLHGPQQARASLPRTCGPGDDVLIRDGRIVQIRGLRDSDRNAAIVLHRGLSERSHYLRFFSLGQRSATDFVDTLLRDMDAGTAIGLVALLHGRLVGLSSLQRTGGASAEVAFVVADALHGQGLATLLLERLAESGVRLGITQFVAGVIAENTAMLDVLRRSGFAVRATRDRETVDVQFPVQLTERLMDAITARETLTNAASMLALFTPGSVAVIGASRREHSPGHTVVRNLVNSGFPGWIYPINPAAETILGRRTYASVLDVPGTIDLAVIAVPARVVPQVVQECARIHVRGLVILSSGFAESGPQAAELQATVMRIARQADMRIVGPNCVGIANTDPAVRLNATLAETPLLHGRVGLVMQSGGVAIAALQRATELGIGLSTFVSAGNKADVSGNDLLMYWDGDEQTRVVAMYLESFGNPRKFSRLARHIGARKPVLALVGGASQAGRRAVNGHSTSAATSNAAVDALFGQCGVIRARSLEELFHVTSLAAHQPLPSGRRVAIVSNGSGQGDLTADACLTAGMEVCDFTVNTEQRIKSLVPTVAVATNPVDLGAGASADEFGQVLKTVADDPNVDVVIAVHTPAPGLGDDDFVAAIGSAADSLSAKTAVAVMLGHRSQRPIEGSVARIPVFAFPEDAVRAIMPLVGYVRWRDAPRGEAPDLDRIDTAAARALVSDRLAAHPDGCRLAAADAHLLLATYGIDTVSALRTDDVTPTTQAADRLGYPVMMKTADPAAGVLVQPQIAVRGPELIVGMTQDDVFGPVVLFGIGGTSTDLIADRVVRLAPLTDVDAATAVRSLRSSPLLFGYRGAPPVDVAAIENLLLRVGRIAEDLPQIAEIDLNPVMTSADGVAIVDANVRLQPCGEHPSPVLPGLRPVASP